MSLKDLKISNIKTRQNQRDEVVKIFFFSNYTKKNKEKMWRVNIYIGTHIISKLGWKEKDYIFVGRTTEVSDFLNDENYSKSLVLYKNTSNDIYGFKGFLLHKVKDSYSYYISFTWDDQLEIAKYMENGKHSVKTAPHVIVNNSDKEEGDYIKISYTTTIIEKEKNKI